MNDFDPFEVLGIVPTDDDAVIRAAYLAGVRSHPPDRDPEEFQRVRRAYDAVRDRGRRFDRRMFGPDALSSVREIVSLVADERGYTGPEAWLKVAAGGRSR